METLHDIASKLKRPAFVNQIKITGMTEDQKKEAATILTVLPKLMNQMIVQILLDSELESNQKQMENRKLHIESSVSDKALLGYCTFHHMLLHLMQSRPYLTQMIDIHVDRFMRSEEYRDKEHVPDLGEFLVLLSLSNFSWLQVATTVVKEIFLRNVRWVLRASPSLKRIQSTSNGFDENRLMMFFKNSKTSKRLLMFQVYFMLQLGSPSGKDQSELLHKYNLSFGRPSEATKIALANNTRAVMKVSTWPEFFDRVLITCPSKTTLTKMLISAQQTASRRKGYHDGEAAAQPHFNPKDQRQRSANNQRSHHRY
jgi:hypothetical protein